MRVLVAAFTFLALAAGPAAAEVVSASPSMFIVRGEANVTASPERAWRALSQIGRWWNSSHTYSGDARRLSLEPRAGGCWCERWGDGQSVEHGRVILVMQHEGVRTLRTSGGLGPLQETGVVGTMTWTVAPHANGATITMTYRATGDSSLGLDQMAALVDGVLMEQFGRLSRYSASGSPD
jgi:uncharacterized protein YndB with AHSA1/START domain